MQEADGLDWSDRIGSDRRMWHARIRYSADSTRVGGCGSESGTARDGAIRMLSSGKRYGRECGVKGGSWDGDGKASREDVIGRGAEESTERHLNAR